MTTLLPVTINGAQYVGQAEYTTGPIVNAYRAQLLVFAELYNLGVVPRPAFQNTTDPAVNNPAMVRSIILDPANDYATRARNAITNFLLLAQNGLPDPNDPTSPVNPHFFTIEMSQAVDQLIKTLKAAGAIILPGQPPVITIDNILVWKDLAASSTVIGEILTFADSSSSTTNRTLQALIELVYVKTGNDIITENLNNLEKALSTTKDSITTLTKLQELHNKIEIGTVGVWLSGDLETRNTIPAQITLSIGITALNGVSGRIGDPPNTAWDRIQSIVNADSWHGAFNVSNSGPLGALGLLAYDFLKAGATANFIIENNARIGLVKPTTLGTLEGVASIIYQNDAGFAGNVQSLAGQFFKPIDPTVPFLRTLPTGSIIQNITAADRALFLELQKQLQQQIAILSVTTEKLPDGREDPGTLLGQIRKVYDNMQAAIETAGGLGTSARVASALRLWILDNEQVNEGKVEILDANGDPLEGGVIQREITSALTAAQSLNDQQKEEVRRYLFVFEEYYKSASAILTKITQILERMAQAIAR